MLLLPILLFIVGIVTSAHSNTIPAGYDAESFCPPPEKIAPCTCYKDPVTERVTAHCTNFTNSYDIKAIFDRNPDWNLQDVWIENCTMPFLPAKMLEDAYFETLNVTSTSLVTLFDTTPVKTPELNLYLIDVKVLRGFQWRDIANATLLEMGTVNMKIKKLDKDFKNNIPKGVQLLWFENTGIKKIKDKAFSKLQKLKILGLKGGSLKKLSRDSFPKPWDVTYLDFSYQKIAALPEDMFVDLPKLSAFFFVGNYLTTLSEKVFTKHDVIYAFVGNPIDCNCNIKWIVGNLLPEFLEGECAKPASLKGKELKSLTEDTFRYCH